MIKTMLQFLLVTWTSGVIVGQVMIDVEPIKCNGGTATLSVSAENAAEPIASYLWSDGVSTRIRQAQEGSYCVTVTDANGCTGQQCATVDPGPSELRVYLKTYAAQPLVGCNQQQPVWLVATAEGGTPPYKINGRQGVTRTWRIGSTTVMNVSVEDKNGCTTNARRKVYVLTRRCSRDPNDILGPAGIDTVQWMSVDDTLSYTIRFENDPELATAPAQRVLIEHEFDEHVNPYSFRLGSTFGFGDHTFDIPPNSSIYQTRLDLVSERGVYVDVTAGINVVDQKAFWIFESIDPATGLLPIDPLQGFLPVNDTATGSGEGFVTFSVRPKLSTVTGDSVKAQANIIFDQNEAIVTNTWFNVIDAGVPTTTLDPVVTPRLNDTVVLTMSGFDDPGGSGMDYYELFISQDGGLFESDGLVYPDTLDEILFVGEHGSSYNFYVLGVDRVGNREEKTLGDISVEILDVQQIDGTYPLADEYCAGDTLEVRWTSVSVDSVLVRVSLDSGATFVGLGSAVPFNDSTLQFILDDSLAGGYVQFAYSSSDGNVTDTSAILPVKGAPTVTAGASVDLICQGEYANLLGSGANTYQWSPNLYINNPSLAIPTVTPNDTITYFVIGTDAFGCSDTGSVTIRVRPVPRDTFGIEICLGDSALIDGEWRDSAGYYSVMHSAANGCDSFFVTELIVYDPCEWVGGDVVYVDHTATGANDGTSWTDAFTDLQDALYISNLFDDVLEIWIAEGDYYPGNGMQRELSFVFEDSTRLYGGFAGDEALRSERDAAIHPVMLSGDVGILMDSTDNSLHVVSIDSSCIDCALDGITVSYGRADGVTPPHDRGGGVYSLGSATLRNVTIERNSATTGAALVHGSPSSVLVVEDCILQLNTSGIGKDVLNVQGAILSFKGQSIIKE